MKATMADVAARAGVSQTTVSRVLNRHPRINSETREEVLKAMRELGYRHAPPLEPAAAPERMNVCLAVCPRPEQSNPLGIDFFSEAVAGIQLQAADLRARVSLSTLPANASEADLEGLEREKADGLLLLGYPSLELTASLRRRSIPHVALSGDPTDKLSDAVTVDNFDAGTELCRRLLAAGKTRIASICTEHDNLRMEGFRYEMRRLVLEPLAGLQLLAESTETSAFIAAGHAMAKANESPDAIIVSHHEAAKAVRSLLELLGQGRKLPRLFTFYHAPREPEFPCMTLHPALMGRKAMRRLAAIQANPDDPPETIIVPMTFQDAANL